MCVSECECGPNATENGKYREYPHFFARVPKTEHSPLFRAFFRRFPEFRPPIAMTAQITTSKSAKQDDEDFPTTTVRCTPQSSVVVVVVFRWP